MWLKFIRSAADWDLMDKDTEVEKLLQSLAKAFNWQSVELEALTGLDCHLFEWKPQDRERQLAQLEDGGQVAGSS